MEEPLERKEKSPFRDGPPIGRPADPGDIVHHIPIEREEAPPAFSPIEESPSLPEPWIPQEAIDEVIRSVEAQRAGGKSVRLVIDAGMDAEEITVPPNAALEPLVRRALLLAELEPHRITCTDQEDRVADEIGCGVALFIERLPESFRSLSELSGYILDKTGGFQRGAFQAYLDALPDAADFPKLEPFAQNQVLSVVREMAKGGHLLEVSLNAEAYYQAVSAAPHERLSMSAEWYQGVAALVFEGIAGRHPLTVRTLEALHELAKPLDDETRIQLYAEYANSCGTGTRIQIAEQVLLPLLREEIHPEVDTAVSLAIDRVREGHYRSRRSA